VPISGSLSQVPRTVVFLIKAARASGNKEPRQRSPGYSEHHTGYAVDIGDGAVPATNLNTTFEN